MANGANPPNPYGLPRLNLGQRAENTRRHAAGLPEIVPGEVEPTTGPAGEPQHVWVKTTSVWGDIEAAGLLLEWSHTSAGWMALVWWAETYSGGWMGSQRWVSAERVRPVGGDG